MNEEQMLQQEIEQSVEQAKWHTPLTKITPLSKYLAMVLFVVLPFVGFWLGVEWGKQRAVFTNTQADKVVPLCEELRVSDEEIDAVVADAVVGLEDPWGNDFPLLIGRVEARLGCTIERAVNDKQSVTNVLASQNQQIEQNSIVVGQFPILEKESTWGPCPKEGSCWEKTHLLNDGTLTVEDLDGTKKYTLGMSVVNEYMTYLREHNLQNKNCSTETLPDVWTTYAVYNRPTHIQFPGCVEDTNWIDDLIQTAIAGSASTPKLQQCPDEWIDNQEPCVFETSPDECNNPPRQYYILDGERWEMSEFDSEWVQESCELIVQTVY